ncbi:hypothetical protein [Streptomyces radicis]|uniref:SH3 domain-containing protein n=1 Tax=Streptomyces radicis TaxID=1750517 RepID=A0A3A9WYA8_9ACTN|nr:hypothetical protein [Streptomyces radicis]RKN12796.1 hypothetical protein D7319_02365 [Streptomyces radicis]RKN27439.1 hypothetical protein D7318_00530 [Streptomyces radicis]
MLGSWTLRGAVGALAAALVLSVVVSAESDASSGSRARAAPGVVERWGGGGPAGPTSVGAGGRELVSVRQMAGDFMDVDGQGVRLRMGPGTQYVARGLMYPPDTVYVAMQFDARDPRADWVGVLVEDSVTGLSGWGWMHSDYLRHI